MRRLGLLALALAALLPGACGDGAAPGSGPAARVRAEDHDSFFLWAGVRPQPATIRAKELYILGGEVRRESPAVLEPMRAGVPRLPGKRVWLVVRAARLDWGEGVWRAVERDLRRWDAYGLQLDFDAATPGLADYAAFLRQLRQRLPAQYRLSATGLMDWSANADPAALARLQGVVDEVVVQSYQGTATIPGYERYLARLARVPVPHKVALVQGGAWREPPALRADPLFRGYVVFLVNPR